MPMTHTETSTPPASTQEQIAACEARRHATLSELKSARARASDIAWDIADLEYQLNELYTKRGDTADTQLEQQISGLLSRRTDLEEQSLAQMLSIDELTKRYEHEGRILSHLRGTPLH